MWLLGVFHSICNAFTSFYAAALADAAVELRIPTNVRIVNRLIIILRLFFHLHKVIKSINIYAII